MTGRAFVLFAGPVLVGTVLGYLTGGRLSRLVSVRLRRLWLLWLAAAVQITQRVTATFPTTVGHVLGTALLVLVFALSLLWLGVNIRGRSWPLTAAVGVAVVGALLNALAITANGRMPYRTSAAAAAGLPTASQTAKNAPAGHTTHLLVLGDTIPVPALHAVISIGDIVLAAAVVLLISTAMHHSIQPAPSRATYDLAETPCPRHSPGSASF
ncbi:DUF5317 family protein [Streptomyces sp. NPDC088350]|uniref:DUF5317 family protein n=1 Tax=Streptomyces sp. NPDC088350 TaxID=3365854 RepID=UPI003814CCE9